MWRSCRANPFSDQWSIESTLDKDSSDHWSEWSENGSSDQWYGAFLWAKNPKLSIVPSGFGLNYTGTLYLRCISMKFHACLHTASVSAYHCVKIIRKLAKYQWSTNIWMACTKTFCFTTKLPYNSPEHSCMQPLRWNLYCCKNMAW